MIDYKCICYPDDGIIEKLISRIEKLETQNKDLNESYQGLAAENRYILEKLEQKESSKKIPTAEEYFASYKNDEEQKESAS